MKTYGRLKIGLVNGKTLIGEADELTSIGKVLDNYAANISQGNRNFTISNAGWPNHVDAMSIAYLESKPTLFSKILIAIRDFSK